MAKKNSPPTQSAEYLTDVLEHIDEEDRDEFSELMKNKLAYKDMEDEAKMALEYINPRLSELMVKYGTEKFVHDGKRFYVLRSESVTLSQELLLKAGVKADIVEKCKVRKPYTTVTATAIK